MDNEIPEILDNPKEALASFITELETFYIKSAQEPVLGDR